MVDVNIITEVEMVFDWTGLPGSKV